MGNHPARTQQARSNVTGKVLDSGLPGALQVNWPDKKIYTFGPGGQPIRMSQWLEDHSTTKEYKQGDFVIQDGDIWRLTINAVLGPFDASDWERLTDAARSSAGDPVSSDIYEGGVVSFDATNTLTIEPGNGVIVDNTEPGALVTAVAWARFTAPATYPNETWSFVGIDINNVVSIIPLSQYDAEWRRDHIELAALLWDDATNDIAVLVDTSRRTGGTAETYIDEYEVNGGAYRARGARIDPIPLTLTFGYTDGSVFAMGSRWKTDEKNPNVLRIVGVALADFDRIFSGGITDTGVQDIDPDQWDNAGTLTALAAGSWSIQYIYALQDFTQLYVQYGQTPYPDASAALEALAADWEGLTTRLVTGALLPLAAVVVEQGATSLDDAFIIEAERGDAFGAQRGLFDDSALYRLDGTRALTGDMDADNNQITNAIIDGGRL